ncbi:tRNA pseudouridine(38-40) synthase TruA [Liquorilactobacillus vini]|uniref:tRNA pseudouridine synthase A n=1 Tax=Liquorilactobacillus vini DSM 20605 TaxID=1133569 RepID=A0A0R2CD18_9LACO|nr:tRNA pseudouridine(38-40) synthase TruA [Liquorilactobacillus vini]KRM89447.1 tRNA pseudouridine synthase [Liquorilactobacillus vini DSM 20605]
MTVRYKVTLAYDGTNFAGFQVQPHQRTVQGVLEKAVNRMNKANNYVHIFGSGRTDAGVHALGQVVHFDLVNDVPDSGIVNGLNSMLPLDMQVLQAEHVSANFHARYTTHGKRYLYRVSLCWYVDPFKRFYTGHWKYPLDVTLIREALKDVVGTHDFSSFVAAGSQAKTHVRTIYSATVQMQTAEHELIFEFYGNGFLYNQVRIMVAALLEIGSKRRPVHDFLRLYQVKDRTQCRGTAPASGLYLKEVVY